ncbi:MAG: aminodeoxychorismate lyase [Flavobacteriaceae bacterium]|nr:aminodeoxychorismate lyase [Flavobacteriaceae bacterium]
MYKRKLLVIIGIIGVLIGTYFISSFYQIFFLSNTSFSNEASYVFIDRDDTIDSLEIQLLPLLKSVDRFLLAAEKKGYTTRLRPGKYKLVPDMGNNDLINVLRSQRQTVSVVFNNQERLEDLTIRLADQLEPETSDFLNAFYDIEFLKANGFTTENALSMYLPNSYNAFWDTTPENFRELMLKSYRRFWNNDRIEKAKKIGLTPNEVYILASIVHKESVKKDEQPKIAGLYLNRLRKGMKLQADPTVIFALKRASDNFKQQIKRVLYKDLRLNSPYNTYKINGLTPGPIAMPDLSAIEAVLNPDKHDYLYFVVSPSNPGYHLFAKNLAKHNKNKKEYVSWINKLKIYR